MTAQPISGAQQHTALWVTLTVVVGLLIPAGGFIVTAASRASRFRAGAPALWFLFVIAAVVLTAQVLGLYSFGLPWTQAASSGPATVVD